jgi:hypothetical protein
MAPAGGQDVAQQDLKSFKADHNGTVFINYTALDAAGQQNPAANQALVELHLRAQGDTQDVATSGPAADGHMTAMVKENTVYTLQVIARQGVGDQVVAATTIAYDTIPPGPMAYIDPESLPHSH